MTKKTTEDMIEEITNIRLEATSLSSEVAVAAVDVTKNLNFLKENRGKITEEDFKRMWEETKVQIIECEKNRERWIKLQLRLIEVERELMAAESERSGKPYLH